MREVWHGNKWLREVDLDLLSPMYDAGNKRHFYVNELAQMKDGSYVIPFRWVIFKKRVHADAWEVSFDENVSVPLYLSFDYDLIHLY